MIRAAYEHAQVTGDVEFLTAQLHGMIEMFYLWNSTRDSETGLYFREPVYDAQEYSLVCYVVGGPNGTEVKEWDAWDNDYSMLDHGPLTYRPSHNAYMVANSRTIADIAQLNGRNDLTQTWSDFSSELERNMVSGLWNDDLNFWIDVVQGTNLQVVGRQLVGYFPYRFGIGVGEAFEQGLEFPLVRKFAVETLCLSQCLNSSLGHYNWEFVDMLWRELDYETIVSALFSV